MTRLKQIKVIAMINKDFSGDFVNQDIANSSQNKFLHFDDFIKRGQALNLTLNFKIEPKIPKYPSECSAYFSDKTRRVGYEYITKKITDIDTLKINIDAVEAFYGNSAHLKAEYGGIRIYSSELITELQAGRSIYIYWGFGFLRACTESEAKSFTEYNTEFELYQIKAAAFERFVDEIIRNEYKLALETQSKQIEHAIGVKSKGVFMVQSRLLHDKNFLGIQTKNTVIHLRLFDDYQKGHIKRTAGQLLCGSKPKFALSDDITDDTNYVVTCLRCLKLMQA